MSLDSHSGQMQFFHTAFEIQAKHISYQDRIEEVICDEAVEICKNLDASLVQESWSWRNAHMGRELAKLLFDEKGEIAQEKVSRAIEVLETHLHSLGPERFHDTARKKHVMRMLHLLLESSESIQALKKIRLPTENASAVRLIRDSLLLSDKTRLSDVHAKQAVLSALFTTLRQNVGSCFATAPAILIQQEQPLQLLADLAQLLNMGQLTRVVEGVEYAVPLSVSSGVGDLYRPFYLASFGSSPFKILARSPGFQAAFCAADLIEITQSDEDKKKECEVLLQQSLHLTKSSDPFLLFTPYQLIQTVLLHTFSLTKEDVDAYKAKPSQKVFPELVIRTAPTVGSKDLACQRYLKALDQATHAFKSFTDHALLKSWEFTLASLSESKSDFAKWNLYASLGVHPNEPHGIGESLHIKIEEKLKSLNEQIEEFQSHYDHLFAQAKYLEGRMSRAASQSELGWVRAEYEIRKQEINRALSFRDEIYEKGRKLHSLYPKLIEFYGHKISEYFQEVYDAQMHDITASPYDDSPAGFRLLYKHGRANPSVWTMIHSGEEYIEHLVSFFISTESELQQEPACEGLEKELSELIHTLIEAIKRPEFLESSFFRLARAYHESIVKHPLDHLDQVKRKPWSYISGGTMDTLVACYWSQKPQEEKKWVENETELLAFFIDTMKESRADLQQLYQKKREKNLLSFSPTHAFLTKPGWPLFRQAWESETYTYTWIRDEWVRPQERFLHETILDNRMMDKVIDQWIAFIPHGYRTIIKQALKNFHFSMTAPELREHVVKTLGYEKWLSKGRNLALVLEEFDSVLYRSLPLFPDHQLRERLDILLHQVPEMDSTLKAHFFRHFEKIEETFEKYHILAAEDLLSVAKGVMLMTLKKTSSAIFYHEQFVLAMQKAGLCYPQPFLFADTNWVKNVFGFTVNPGTAQVELWRFDNYGRSGRPISAWKPYVNGSEKREWGIYTHPQQYET